MRTGLLSFASVTVSAGVALAQGCPPAGGEATAEIKDMNQMVLNQRFDALEDALGTYLGADFDSAMVPIAALFKEGFTGCTTVLQRKETDGPVQSMVVYHGDIGPLFGYFLKMTDFRK
jgi:hypothetical protein